MAKKNVEITLYVDELVYDIQNKTDLVGRSSEKNDELVAHMQVNNDEENENQILRSLFSAFTTLKTELSEFLAEKGLTANNVLLSRKSNLTLNLELPSNYNESTREAISHEAHDYLVNKTLTEWFIITHKEMAQDYNSLAKNAIENIRRAIFKRNRPVRKPI